MIACSSCCCVHYSIGQYCVCLGDVLCGSMCWGFGVGSWVEGYDFVLLLDSPLLGMYLTVCLLLLHCVRYTIREWDCVTTFMCSGLGISVLRTEAQSKAWWHWESSCCWGCIFCRLCVDMTGHVSSAAEFNPILAQSHLFVWLSDSLTLGLSVWLPACTSERVCGCVFRRRCSGQPKWMLGMRFVQCGQACGITAAAAALHCT
jgi:hypothetical protein